LLTKTKDIEIFKGSKGKWYIRDYGRGLKYEHLTQKEDDEKLGNPHVIGKFGIGLKDAFATFDRKGVTVLARSRHGDIVLGRSQKQFFEDVITLHAYISPPSDPNFVGTEFVLDGVDDEDIEKAKDLFLRFSGERIMETTKYGAVLERRGNLARIYVNGVKVSEEENFLFSYNITSLTSVIRKALNRERSNVGRSAYSTRVKSILLSCGNKEVAECLVNDLKGYHTGEMHDELKWIDVQEHSVKLLNAFERVVFFTPEELMYAKNMVDEAKTSGYQVITIPENLRQRIQGLKDISGNRVRDLSQFYSEYYESFEFRFVDPNDLTLQERENFRKTDKILNLIGGKPRKIREIKISETMRKEIGSFVERAGVWEESTGRIIIKRSQLKDIAGYAGTLIHEVAHAVSGTTDVSREFENELTSLLGIVVSRALNS